MLRNRPRRFGRKTPAPTIGREPPADLDTRREMGFECGDHQPDGSDESPRFAQFNSVQSEAMFSEVALDSIEKKSALRG
jgi:hypothetical protein